MTLLLHGIISNGNEIISETGAGFLFIFKMRKQAHSELCNCLRLPAALRSAQAGIAEDRQKDKSVSDVIKFTFLRAAILLFWLIPPVLASNSDLQLCYKQAEGASRTLVDLKIECPRVYQALQRSGLSAALEAPLPDKITLAQLKFLQTSTHHSSNLWELDESGLDELLTDIMTDQQADHKATWWNQFLDWLNSFKPEKYETEYDWLIKFLEAVAPSERVARMILYAVFGITILSAAGLVIWELYLAGLFSRRTGRRRNSGKQNIMSVDEHRQQIPLIEIQQLAPELQAVALLNNAISHLTGHGLLPGNPALTNCELEQHLQKHQSIAYTAFACLVANVEPVLYGKLIPSQHSLECCWQNALQILSQ